MNLGQFEAEIEETLANMKPGKTKRKLEKMYFKMKGKKILKVGNTMDKVDISKQKKQCEDAVKEKITEAK